MRIWRSPTSEGSRRQLFWQLASSSCHFGTPNNQRALYVWVSSDKEQETALISHKKQTDWKKKSWPRVSQSCLLERWTLLFYSCSSYISPGFRAKRWVSMEHYGLCFNDRDCGARGQKLKKSRFIHTADPEKNILSKCSLSDLALKQVSIVYTLFTYVT